MPAQKRKTSTKINLIPSGEFESSTIGRILKWLLSSFRIIVILVELVVLVVFLSRFWLDAKNSDLNDIIKQKQAQIRASSNFEKEFRAVQTKLDVYGILVDSQEEKDVLEAIVSSLPSEVRLDSVSLDEEEIVLTGVTLSEQSIGNYIANLRAQTPLRRVNLTSIEKSSVDEIYLKFNLSINTNKRS